ncbi:Uncharacterized protein Fot_06953 [Forsythia ovata]|uniref:Uncharacterized protein n=1 Tax=Forsythia ovata TaxID=205694 RepID=A0ABD1WUE9_9LAMI
MRCYAAAGARIPTTAKGANSRRKYRWQLGRAARQARVLASKSLGTGCLRLRTTMAGWHCSSQNTPHSKLSYFFDKPILACVLQGKHIHQSDRLEKCQAPSLSTICHSSLA